RSRLFRTGPDERLRVAGQCRPILRRARTKSGRDQHLDAGECMSGQKKIMPNNAGEADTHDLATAYEPTEHERAALKAYFARDETCPPAPRMKVVQTDGAKAFKIDHP